MSHSKEPRRIEPPLNQEYDTIVCSCGNEQGFFMRREVVKADGTRVGKSATDYCDDRILACVNFCRQFPTAWLAKHQLHFAKDTALPTPNEGYTGLCAVVKNEVPHE